MALESAVTKKCVCLISAAIDTLVWDSNQIRGNIVVSISACHAEDPGSIPGRGVGLELMAVGSATSKVQVALWPRL